MALLTLKTSKWVSGTLKKNDWSLLGFYFFLLKSFVHWINIADNNENISLKMGN